MSYTIQYIQKGEKDSTEDKVLKTDIVPFPVNLNMLIPFVCEKDNAALYVCLKDDRGCILSRVDFAFEKSFAAMEAVESFYSNNSSTEGGDLYDYPEPRSKAAI